MAKVLLKQEKQVLVKQEKNGFVKQEQEEQALVKQKKQDFYEFTNHLRSNFSDAGEDDICEAEAGGAGLGEAE